MRSSSLLLSLVWPAAASFLLACATDPPPSTPPSTLPLPPSAHPSPDPPPAIPPMLGKDDAGLAPLATDASAPTTFDAGPLGTTVDGGVHP